VTEGGRDRTPRHAPAGHRTLPASPPGRRDQAASRTVTASGVRGRDTGSKGVPVGGHARPRGPAAASLRNFRRLTKRSLRRGARNHEAANEAITAPRGGPSKAPAVKIPGREALGNRLAPGKGSGSCARVVTFVQPKEPARPLVVRTRESAPRARNALLCGLLPRERPATGDSAPGGGARYVIPLRSLPAGRPLRTVPRRPKPGRRTGIREAQDARDPRSLRRGGSVAA
jgi:hypothetical protein